MAPRRDLEHLKKRVVGILTRPADEWPAIAAEQTDPVALMTGYAAPLAAIPAVCRLIGLNVIGAWLPLVGTYRVGIVRSILSAIVSWLLSLAVLYVAAIVVERLAPTFKSSRGIVPALKLVVYASTPVWIVGVLNLFPVFVPLTLLAALFAAYLFSVGLPSVAHTPADQVIPYMFVATLIAIALFLVLDLAGRMIAGGGYAGV